MNKKISTPIALGIILILATIVGGFTIWQYSEIRKEQQILLPEIKIPEKKIYENADWKNYTNEKYGYELRYPLGWEIIEKNTLMDKVFIIEIKSPQEDNSDLYRENFNLIVTNISDEPITLQELTELSISEIDKSIINGEIIDSIDYSINGNPAYKLIYTTDFFPGAEKYRLQQMAVWTIKNEKTYLITYTAEENKYSNFLEIIQGIIDSFKFTEKDETADWKTYRNEEYGFEIKYPENWKIKEEHDFQDFYQDDTASTKITKEPLKISLHSENYFDKYNYSIPDTVILSITDKSHVQIRNNSKVGTFDYDAKENKWFILSPVTFGIKTPECPPIIDLNENIKGYYGIANLMSEGCYDLTYIILNKDYAIRIEEPCDGSHPSKEKVISSLELIDDVKIIEAGCE
jgi:hypothetical protein